MSKPLIHAKSSAKRFGGVWEDYMEIHELLDSSKGAFPDNRHRVLTHNSWFISYIIPKIFGETFARKSDNVVVSTRDVAEQHVLEDYKMRFIPTAQDFIQEMKFQPWMQNGMGEAPTSHKMISQMLKENRDQMRPTRRPVQHNPLVVDGTRGGDKYDRFEVLKTIPPVEIKEEEIKIISSAAVIFDGMATNNFDINLD